MELIKDERFEHIYMVDTFPREYKKLFGKSSAIYKEELERLAQNLYILDTEMEDALQLQQFEQLTAKAPLCSIRHVSKTNPRVIFIFEKTESAVILLACALEKSKKDYEEVTARAKARLRALEEN